MVTKSEDRGRGHTDKKFGGQYENRSRGPSEPADQSFRRHRTEKMGKMVPVFEKSRGHTRKDPIFGWFEDQ